MRTAAAKVGFFWAVGLAMQIGGHRKQGGGTGKDFVHVTSN
jgi:hypothetical protein